MTTSCPTRADLAHAGLFPPRCGAKAYGWKSTRPFGPVAPHSAKGEGGSCASAPLALIPKTRILSVADFVTKRCLPDLSVRRASRAVPDPSANGDPANG